MRPSLSAKKTAKQAVPRKPQRPRTKRVAPHVITPAQRDTGVPDVDADVPGSRRRSERRCPVCDSGMIRKHLRVVDRLLNGGIAVRRYRCSRPACAHELLSRPDTLDAAARPWVVSASLTAIAIVLGLYLMSDMQGFQEGLEPEPSLVSQPSEEPAEALSTSTRWNLSDVDPHFEAAEKASASALRR